MTQEPYFLAIQRNSSRSIYCAGVEVPVWTSESFPNVETAQDAIAGFCGYDPETIERCDFVIIEISPPPE